MVHKRQNNRKAAIPWLLTGSRLILFLAIQHCTLPFIPDARFILYRGLVFLPFALMLGVSLKLRPSLFPYFAVLHGVMDFGTAMMYLTV